MQSLLHVVQLIILRFEIPFEDLFEVSDHCGVRVHIILPFEYRLNKFRKLFVLLSDVGVLLSARRVHTGVQAVAAEIPVSRVLAFHLELICIWFVIS